MTLWRFTVKFVTIYPIFLSCCKSCIASILETCFTNFDCKCSVTSYSYYYYRYYSKCNNQLCFYFPFTQLRYHCKKYRGKVTNIQTNYKLSIFLYYYHDDVNTRKKLWQFISYSVVIIREED